MLQWAWTAGISLRSCFHVFWINTHVHRHFTGGKAGSRQSQDPARDLRGRGSPGGNLPPPTALWSRLAVWCLPGSVPSPWLCGVVWSLGALQPCALLPWPPPGFSHPHGHLQQGRKWFCLYRKDGWIRGLISKGRKAAPQLASSLLCALNEIPLLYVPFRKKKRTLGKEFREMNWPW